MHVEKLVISGAKARVWRTSDGLKLRIIRDDPQIGRGSGSAWEHLTDKQLLAYIYKHHLEDTLDDYLIAMRERSREVLDNG